MVGIDHVRFLQDLRAKWEAILVSSLFLARHSLASKKQRQSFFFQLKRLSNVLEMKIFSSTLPHNKKSRWSIHPPTSPRVHTCCVYSRVYTTITFRVADFFCLFNYRLMQSQKKGVEPARLLSLGSLQPLIFNAFLVNASGCPKAHDWTDVSKFREDEELIKWMCWLFSSSSVPLWKTTWPVHFW